MKRIRPALAALLLLLPGTLCAQNLKDFRRPPEECKIKTWWFFGYEQTADEGIRADAESLRDAGFGGVVYYDQNHAKTPSPLADKAFSPEWWHHLESAAREAEKAGLSFELNISNGYVAGGKWIDPRHAMQRVTSAAVRVEGGRRVEMELPDISGRDAYVDDIALLAFPAPADGLIRHFTAQYAPKGKGRTGAMQTPGPRGDFSGAKWTARLPIGMLQASPDSLHWTDVVELEPLYAGQGTYPWRTEAFHAVDAPFWRIDYYSDERLRSWSVGAEASVDRWEELSALQSDFAEPRSTPCYGPDEVIAAADIVDLSDRVGPDGRLRWDAPEGSWTVLRLAATLTGAKSKHGRAELLGYECDKLSAEAARLHWDSYMQPILDRLRSDGIDNVTGVCMDSHEGGSQNWTPLMKEEFARRRGYRLEPWLPVLAGYVVESYGRSCEVLRDLRRTVSDCLIDNYYGTFQTQARRNGLTFTAQAIGNALCITGDAVEAKKGIDKPQSEFWSYQQDGAYDIKDCSSAAHLYGKPVASAEAMTDATYDDTPHTLARVSNIALSFGAQEFVVCATPHIPQAEPAGPYFAGREYAINRSNPIWADLKPLWRQIARATYMLRQGQAAPDVLVYLGDDLPVKTLTGRLPAGLDGLDWDVCTGDALRSRLHVAPDACLCTPDGLKYKALVIGDGAWISAASDSTLQAFRAQGAAVLTDASELVRPFRILDRPEAFVHTHRLVDGHELFFVANISENPESLRFALAESPRSVQVWRTADASRRRLRPDRDGSYTLRLEGDESVFILY